MNLAKDGTDQANLIHIGYTVDMGNAGNVLVSAKLNGGLYTLIIWRNGTLNTTDMKTNYKHNGVVKFFNVGRLYGFITDVQTGKDYFCHNNGLACHIKKGDNVTFEIAECDRGVEAINVTLIDNNNLLSIRCDGNRDKTVQE
jgi:cold shock protein